ncbi:MAG: tRNA (adenosine(37)-N6)-threonylcarbamoyltransferase complex ATPase subunit type 1 TsaE [Methylotenera sp.]|nr:MAG: tRNA (adenosine(37)-N6)-threonylcarbamoyltransferase complex ATPase subunit type 1 TsaE [Methylotenera sp.]
MDNNFTRDCLDIHLDDEAATLAFGKQLANAIEPGLVLYLHGDLGAGKTTLVRGLLHALGYAGKVKSPTYTLVENYKIEQALSVLNLYHFDLYRFNDDEEWEAAGFRDYFNAESVCLIEWPEKAEKVLPLPDINITFTILVTGRKVTLDAPTRHGSECLTQVMKEISSR